MSRHPPYPRYKPSGIEWLGEIPEHWEVKRLKYLFKTVNGSTPQSGVSEYWDGDIPWVTPDDLGNLQSDTVFDTRRRITTAGYQGCGTAIAPAGSLVLSTRAPIGHLAIAGIDLCTNQGCRCLVFKSDDHNRFYYYFLVIARGELESLGRGSTFKELGSDELEAVGVPKPSILEQRAIADFLDRETAKIDALIAKKQRLIELLNEKRTALISHAVTKGLDPNVPMKDSGIEWLGEIPEHWEAKRLKCAYSINPSRREVGQMPRDLAVSFVPMEKIGEDGTLTLDETKMFADVQQGFTYFREGDVIVAKITPCFENGKGALAKGLSNGIGFGTTELHVLRTNGTDDSRFLYYLTIMQPFRALGVASMYGVAGQQRVTDEYVKDFVVPIPSRSEQRAIADFLDRETAKIDALIREVQKATERLGEYRSSLISAAVTGKIDVRESVAYADAHEERLWAAEQKPNYNTQAE